jgi:predicted RND superfamily exporter protein
MEWAPEDRPTQEKIREANHFLSQIVPLLAAAPANPQVASRLAGFEKQFFADLRDKWQLLQANLQSAPPTLEDLPPSIVKRFLSPQGTYLIQVFPSQDIWNPQPLEQFVQDLRSVDPKVVGDPVLLYVFTLAFRNSCLWAAGMALLAVAVMILVLFRSLKLTMLALLPLWVGTAMTLNLMWLLGLPFNQANVLFLPLILGEGVEFGIIILTRWQLEEDARAITLPASTAKGVILAAITTTVGFGSLMVSSHPGVFSLGLLATVGSLSVLLASLSVLPALLHLMKKSYPGPEPEVHPILGLRRWIWHVVRKEAP